MSFSLLPRLFVFSILAQSFFALPYVFRRTLNDTTSLAPNISSIQQDLGPRLSQGATLYFPNSSQFEDATSRWSAYAEPQISVIVKPAIAEDVAATVLSLP